MGSGTVSVIDVQANRVVHTIGVGSFPNAIAITPDGKTAYVALEGNVAVLDTRTNRVVAKVNTPVRPFGIAVTPDGKTAYVAVHSKEGLAAIEGRTNRLLAPISIGGVPLGWWTDLTDVAITPDGTTAYVTNGTRLAPNVPGGSVSVVDTRTNQTVGQPIPVGDFPAAIAIAPDGGSAYVANAEADSVSVIDTQANQVIGPPIAVGKGPVGLAITEDGESAYVANSEGGNVAVLDTKTNRVVRSIALGGTPWGVAIAPDTLTGYPRIPFRARVKCPARAAPAGCAFEIQAVTKQLNGSPETDLGKAKVRAGQSALVTLTPKPTFSSKLATAATVLIRERIRIAGAVQTRYRRLKPIR